MIIENAKHIKFTSVNNKESSLTSFEPIIDVPFIIKRVFTVNAIFACNRGCHAHKLCNQILVCLNGNCTVTVDDGVNKKQIELFKPEDGLYIPSGIWAEQKYSNNSILIVFADQVYDEFDYIRNYADFLKFKKGY